MEFSIYRYDPAKDQKPYYQSFTFERTAVTGQMVLDALEHLKTIDPTLSLGDHVVVVSVVRTV